MAGLYEFWRDPAVADPDDPLAWLSTFTVVTGPAEPGLDRIHDRQPVVLEPEEWATWLDPATGAADVLGLLEHQFEMHRIRVRRELSETPVVVLGLEHKLQQVFLNLFLNARDAMPKGGWLSIATRTEGTRVIAEVSDTGSGIPSEYLARIYDPFFTTKAIGQGTGLGLSITYGIVREHEGSIECESGIGQGTTFILSFPAVAGERSVLASQGMSGRAAGPGQGL